MNIHLIIHSKPLLKKNNFLLLVLAFVLSFTLNNEKTLAAKLTPKDIVAKSDEKRGPQGSFSMIATVDFVDGKDIQKSVYSVKVKDTENSLVDQTEPERNRGRRLLMKSYDMWLFTPNIKRPVRVGMEQRLTGDVSNGDIARTNFKDDYDAKIEGEEFVGKDDTYKILLIAKNKSVTYSKIHIWIAKKDFAPMKATFYALSGKALKNAVWEDYKMIDGLSRSTKMVIRDYLKKDRVSTVVYSKHKLESFSDSMFNKDQMEF